MCGSADLVPALARELKQPRRPQGAGGRPTGHRTRTTGASRGSTVSFIRVPTPSFFWRTSRKSRRCAVIEPSVPDFSTVPFALRRLTVPRPRTQPRGSLPRESRSRPGYGLGPGRVDHLHGCPGSLRSFVAPIPPCMRCGRGPSASTRGFQPPRTPTPSIAATWQPVRRGFRSPSTCRPTAAMTRTTHASGAT